MSKVIDDLLDGITLPKMIRVRQKFPRPIIKREDIPLIIDGLLSENKFSNTIKPGMRVCITAGSRGVCNVDVITKSIADFCKKQGALPFVVPAMGSHGGATAEGQLEILEALNVTEKTVGCPIVSCMDTVIVGYSEEGYEVRIDKNAAEADAIIVSCRIKPHTAFRGPYESGLMKMMTIGLGKQKGAESCHASGFKYLSHLVPTFGRIIMKNAPIVFGVASIENAFEETAKLIALTPDEIDKYEPDYLKESAKLMAKIYFDECDVLVVDEIGKNISGEGMDPNISGTFATEISGGIKAQKRCILGLTEATHGNGHGMGMVDIISKRVFDQVDLEKTYPNSITATVLCFARIPMIMQNDINTIKLCIKTCNEIEKDKVRLIRIKNTMDIEYIYISEAMLDEAKANPNLEILGEPEEFPFNEYGNLW